MRSSLLSNKGGYGKLLLNNKGEGFGSGWCGDLEVDFLRGAHFTLFLD